MSNCLAKLIGPLQAKQFRVVNVADREEVVNVGRSETPHLVLLDLKSPFDVLEKESARSYRGHSSVCKKLYAWTRIYEGNWCYIRVHSTDAGRVLDLIKADPEAALHKLRRRSYFRLAA